MVHSTSFDDTPDLSESMKKRLVKEQEVYRDQLMARSNYPNLNSLDQDEEEDEDKMREKLQKLPQPPPEYPKFPTASDEGLKRNGPLIPNHSSNGKLPNYSLSPSTGIHRQTLQISVSDPDFEGKLGCFQLTSEGIVCFLFDTLLIFLELMVNLWLGFLLKDQGNRGQFQAIVVFFFVPSVINAIVWVKLSKYYKEITFFFMMAVVFFGFPSPIFVYVWHLYLTAFCDQKSSQRSKILANIFRIIQAFTSSLPLLVINLYTLLDILKMEGKEEEALDISQLTNHLDQVKIHGLAALVSFINIMRAASVFNERKTYTLLFVMVGYPFLLFTILSRILALGVIACFMDFWWTVVLFFGLLLTNLALYAVCKKRMPSIPINSGLPTSEQIIQFVPIRGDIEEQIELRSKILEQQQSTDSSTNDISCCNSKHGNAPPRTSPTNNWKWVPQGERSFWNLFPKLVLMSTCSIAIPVGYTNDYRSHHPRIKGGLFITLNFLFNMIWIGLALGFTIINNVPNTFHGVSFPQPSLKVEVPGSKVLVQAGGLDVSLNLPNTQIDLGSMPTFSATLNTDTNDLHHAILIPIVLCLITLPFVIMRAAMMELDCFLARKKEVDDPTIAQRKRGESANGEDQVDGFFNATKNILGEVVKSNAENKELKARLYLTVCCSVCGMCVFTVMLIVTAALTMLNFT